MSHANSPLIASPLTMRTTQNHHQASKTNPFRRLYIGATDLIDMTNSFIPTILSTMKQPYVTFRPHIPFQGWQKLHSSLFLHGTQYYSATASLEKTETQHSQLPHNNYSSCYLCKAS